MNDRIHGAHSLTKTNTTSVETFLSPINGLIGTVNYGKSRVFPQAISQTHLSK
jgi:L-asparaginase